MADPEARCQIYISVLKHISTLEVDWKAFAEAQGISLPGNAQRKFKECLKKDGFAYASGEITALDGDTASKAAPAKRKKSEVKTEKAPKKAETSKPKEEKDDTEELKAESSEAEDKEEVDAE